MIKPMVFEMYVLAGLYFIIFLIRMNFQLGDTEKIIFFYIESGKILRI